MGAGGSRFLYLDTQSEGLSAAKPRFFAPEGRVSRIDENTKSK